MFSNLKKNIKSKFIFIKVNYKNLKYLFKYNITQIVKINKGEDDGKFSYPFEFL